MKLRRDTSRAKTGWLPVMLVALTVACSNQKDEKAEADDSWGGGKDEKKAEDEAVPVEVVALATGPMEEVLRFSTHLEAESGVKVLANSSRQVERLLVEEGDRVRAGQVLLHLQDDEQRSEVARLEAELAKTRRQHQRQESLLERGLVSEQTVQDLAYERERMDLLVRDAKLRLGDTVVKAPISGTVTNRMVQVGDHVTPNQHLFDLADFDTLVARIYAPEKDLHRLSMGLTARVHTQGPTVPAFSGQVSRLAPLVDPTTGTVKVTVAVPPDPLLRPGMFVELELITQQYEDALRIPKRALVHDRELSYVFRVKDETNDDGKAIAKAEKIVVQPRLDDGHHVVPAPADGFAPGDRIVIAGQAGLKQDSKVRIVGDEPEPTEDIEPTKSSDLTNDQVAASATDADADAESRGT
ncbi:MAG: efflux RND transporter periplasmic adaptor subunit [Acidobacteriota bacterium]